VARTGGPPKDMHLLRYPSCPRGQPAPAAPSGFRPMTAEAEAVNLPANYAEPPFSFRVKDGRDVDGDGKNEIVLIDERNL